MATNHPTIPTNRAQRSRRRCDRRHTRDGTPEYRTWESILARCYNKNCRSYPRYGERGIAVCNRWRASFDAFLADMGRKPSAAHSLDRIDNDGPYSPENCRWATRAEQSRNKRNTLRVVYAGVEMCAAEFAALIGLSRSAVGRHLGRGETPEQIAARHFARSAQEPAKQPTGRRGSPEYAIWRGMKQRCACPTDRAYPSYGGKGIRVCQRWLNSFEAFLTDVGYRPSPDHSLDRYPDKNGNYEPSNCRWATRVEQSRNRRSNHLVTFQGQAKCIAEWAGETGIPSTIISVRINKLGWSAERALTEPVHFRGRGGA